MVAQYHAASPETPNRGNTLLIKKFILALRPGCSCEMRTRVFSSIILDPDGLLW